MNQQIEIKNKLDEGLTFKISRFKEQIKRTKPHKHDDYFELIFLSEGEGFQCFESEKYMVDVPDFYFLRPSHFIIGNLHLFQEGTLFLSTKGNLIQSVRQIYWNSYKNFMIFKDFDLNQRNSLIFS